MMGEGGQMPHVGSAILAVCQKAPFRPKVTSNSEKIRPVAIVKLCLSRGSQLVEYMHNLD